jgi:hypothetical protein
VQWFADAEVTAKKTAEGKVEARNKGELATFAVPLGLPR